MSWLKVLPGPTKTGAHASGRWRAQLLAGLHGVLGDDPSLRLLNVVEYGCASLPRAVRTLRCAVLEPMEQAEWGFAEPLAEDVAAVARERRLKVQRLSFEQPEEASPLIAEMFRNWYAAHGLRTDRLLISSFLLMDPVLAMRTGMVPYWALFATRPSLDRLAGYLSRTARYDDIRLAVFPHGAQSIGLPNIGEWQATLTYTGHDTGQLLAVEPSRSPRHFRALSGFHRELSRLPRVPEVPPLNWDAAQHHLAKHSATHSVTFG